MADIVTTPPRPDSGSFRRDRSKSWLGGELRWAGATFLKVAVSVALARAVSRVFGVPLSRLQEKAQDLSEFGRRRKPYSDIRGGSGNSSSSFGNPGGGFTSGSASGSTFSRKREAPPYSGDTARFVKRVNNYELYQHSHVFDGHLWPCPIASRQECRDCTWLVVSRDGTACCTCVEKIRQILDGRDDGSDLYELKGRIERDS